MKKQKQPTPARSGSVKRRSAASTRHELNHSRAKHVLRSRRSWSQRLFMHPTMSFGLLIAGVLLAALTFKAAADTYTVHAVVGASKLTSGATITSLVNGQTVPNRPITVSGDCPNESYIKLQRNGTFSGAALCTNNRFHIQSDLIQGRNDLQAQAFTVTDQPSPLSAVRTVIYSPAAGTADVKPSGFKLAGDYRFTIIPTSEAYNWKLRPVAGLPPYDVQVDWGDGEKTVMKITNDSDFGLHHNYKARGQYPVNVTATDVNRRKTTMQLVAFIREPNDTFAAGSIISRSSGVSDIAANGPYQWLYYAWPTYAVIGMMVMSFWLGERREYLLLMTNKSGNRLRHAA